MDLRNGMNEGCVRSLVVVWGARQLVAYKQAVNQVEYLILKLVLLIVRTHFFFFDQEFIERQLLTRKL